MRFLDYLRKSVLLNKLTIKKTRYSCFANNIMLGIHSVNLGFLLKFLYLSTF